MILQQGSQGNNVRILQTDLNSIYPQDRPQLKVDGIFGMKTRDWVCKFQRINGLKVDGIAGPITLGKIQSKKTSGGGAPPPSPPTPPNPNLPASAHRFQNDMRRVFEEQGKTSEWMNFWNSFEQNTIPEMKIFLGAIGRAEDARVLARFFLELRSWGFSAREIGVMFAKFNTMNGEKAVKLFELVIAPGGKFGGLMKLAGETASRLGLLVTAVECAMHASRGDYSAIAAEIYKFYMGKAIPWAAMIEGLGSLLDGVMPEETRKTSLLFRILRGFDPIGLGAAGIDSMAAIIIAVYEMIVAGKVDADIVMPRLQRLVARLKQGPTAVFAEIGENSADAVYAIAQMDRADWEQLLNYSSSELKDYFSK